MYLVFSVKIYGDCESVQVWQLLVKSQSLWGTNHVNRFVMFNCGEKNVKKWEEHDINKNNPKIPIPILNGFYDN